MKGKKKWELLKYAYDNYPKGTKCNALVLIPKKEFECSGNYIIDDFGIKCAETGWFIYNTSDKWAEIVKPKKIAVKVENEKEFHALIRYYDSLGWKCQFGDKPLELDYSCAYPLSFENNFCRVNLMDSYQIIPFTQFAKEHDIKLPLIKSEDGVWLYLDSPIVVVRGLEISSEYDCLGYGNGDYNIHPENPTLDGIRKIFSTKQSALEWIEAQKPKEVIVQLFDKNVKASVSKKEIIFKWGKSMDNYLVYKIMPSDIEEIQKALKELR